MIYIKKGNEPDSLTKYRKATKTRMISAKTYWKSKDIYVPTV